MTLLLLGAAPLAFFLQLGGSPPGSSSVSTSSAGPALARPIAPTGTLFVSAAATGANDGSSWSDAFADLQQALAVAEGGDEIWVAAGTYRPAGPGGASSATFAIPSNVRLYGGFAGGETSLAQRDVGANPTVLSGDLVGDDTYTPVFDVGWGDNVWTVVTLSGTAPATRLDGFEIVGGHFHGSSGADANGAGIRVEGGAATIANCVVSWCVANHGGGMLVSSAEAVVTDSDFHHNWATTASFAGGAVATEGGATLHLRRSGFRYNTADGVASGVAGGALANESGSTVVVEGCTFLGNKAENRLPGMISIARGGAIYNEFGGSLVVDSSRFTANTSNSGGAIFGWSTSNTLLLNSVFESNWVTKYVQSGGIEGGGDGGTIVGGAATQMVGCVVYGGDADNVGGASVEGGLVSGCVFWANTDDKGDIGISQVKADEIRYSCVQNMLVPEPGEDPPDPNDFPGCIDADPLFVDPLSGDYRPAAGSPLIDAGENPAWPAGVTTDFGGAPRFVDDPLTPDSGVGPAPVVDMGPHERQG